MAIEIKVPALPESVADATVLEWHKKPGEPIKRDENIVDLETDKIVLEVTAPTDGTLSSIAAEVGTVVEDGALLAIFDELGSTAPAGETETAPEPAESAPAPAEASTGSETIEIKVPPLPESVADATVLEWHKKPGEPVNRDENIVDLETDKVVLEVTAPADGVINSIAAETGTVVEDGALLALFEQGGASTVAAPAAATSGTHEPVSQAPQGASARKALADNNLSASDVQGSGKGGRILKEDVQNAASTATTTTVTAAPTVAAEVTRNETGYQADVSGQTERQQVREPMSRMRTTIANRLVSAQQTTAMLTTFNEVDMSAVMNMRNKYKDLFVEQHDTKLGFMSFFVKAATAALQKFPMVNAQIDGTDIVKANYEDIGIAVSSPRGLVVPIIRSAANLNFAQIEDTIKDFGARAQKGTIAMDELTGGTFTITNGGIFGSMLSTPILNPPQSAILGMHSIQKRAVVINDEVVVRPIMYLALSYDHRIVDGRDAVQFLVAIKNAIEDPTRLLLDIK